MGEEHFSFSKHQILLDSHTLICNPQNEFHYVSLTGIHYELRNGELVVQGYSSASTVDVISLYIKSKSSSYSEKIWKDNTYMPVKEQEKIFILNSPQEMIIHDKKIDVWQCSTTLYIRGINGKTALHSVSSFLSSEQMKSPGLNIPIPTLLGRQLPNIQLPTLPSLSLPNFFPSPKLICLTREDSDYNDNPEMELFIEVMKDAKFKQEVIAISSFIKQLDAFAFPIIYGLNRFESFASSFHSLLEQVQSQLKNHDAYLAEKIGGEDHILRILNGCESYIILYGYQNINQRNEGLFDLEFSRITTALSLSIKDNQFSALLGISESSLSKPDLENLIFEAGIEILRFINLKTPIKKLSSLYKIHQLIILYLQKAEHIVDEESDVYRIEENHQGEHSGNSDELLSFLIFIIMKINPYSLGASLNFTKLLRSPQRYQQATNYTLGSQELRHIC